MKSWKWLVVSKKMEKHASIPRYGQMYPGRSDGLTWGFQHT